MLASFFVAKKANGLDWTNIDPQQKKMTFIEFKILQNRSFPLKAGACVGIQFHVIQLLNFLTKGFWTGSAGTKQHLLGMIEAQYDLDIEL